MGIFLVLKFVVLGTGFFLQYLKLFLYINIFWLEGWYVRKLFIFVGVEEYLCLFVFNKYFEEGMIFLYFEV